MKQLLIAVAASAVVAGCAATSPYQPATSSTSSGYSEQAIESNRLKVSFKGNASTPKEQVETFLLYRAAELTLENGFDWFYVADRDVEGKSRYRADYQSPFYSRYGFGYRYFHPRFGWYRAYDPFWRNSTSYTEVTKYQADAEIIMRAGEKPEDEPRAFDAREVQSNLAQSVLAPE